MMNVSCLTVPGADRARELAKQLGPINMPPGNENRLLTTLTGTVYKILIAK